VTRDELARPPPSVIKQTKQESTVSSATAGNFPFKKARLLLICGRTSRTLFVDAANDQQPAGLTVTNSKLYSTETRV
jgi:hypothetical protein